MAWMLAEVPVETDAVSGACYFRLSNEPIARTIHASDLVMIDVDRSGHPVGVEFAGGLPPLHHQDWHNAVGAMPELKDLFYSKL